MQFTHIDLQLFTSFGEHIGYLSPINEDDLSDEFCFKYWEWREVNSIFFLTRFENSPDRVKNWFLNKIIKDKKRKSYTVKDINGTLIGVCGFKNLKVDKVELDTMMRGQSSGHPEIMISAQRALIWYLFSQVGVKSIGGKVLSKNLVVRIFHKRFGFKEIRRVPLAEKSVIN